MVGSTIPRPSTSGTTHTQWYTFGENHTVSTGRPLRSLSCQWVSILLGNPPHWLPVSYTISQFPTSFHLQSLKQWKEINVNQWRQGASSVFRVIYSIYHFLNSSENRSLAVFPLPHRHASAQLLSDSRPTQAVLNPHPKLRVGHSLALPQPARHVNPAALPGF